MKCTSYQCDECKKRSLYYRDIFAIAQRIGSKYYAPLNPIDCVEADYHFCSGDCAELWRLKQVVHNRQETTR